MDIYNNFQELSLGRTEGVDYIIDTQDRRTDVVIVGIHGGRIEPGTAEVVRAIAGEDLSYYLLIGKKEGQHITSIHFDEKECLRLVASSKFVVAIHGKKGSEENLMLGGLDTELIVKIRTALEGGGFEVIPTGSTLTGNQTENICNKGSSGKGLQIELSRGLRESLFHNPERLEAFAQAVRSSII